MRIDSVSVTKGRRPSTSHLKPTEGSKLRMLYDILYDNKGASVHIAPEFMRNNRSYVTQLRDFYGLDVRYYKKGYYILVGEWFDTVYIDYMVHGELYK